MIYEEARKSFPTVTTREQRAWSSRVGAQGWPGPCRGDAEPQGRLRELSAFAVRRGVKQRRRRRQRWPLLTATLPRSLDPLEPALLAVRADALPRPHSAAAR